MPPRSICSRDGCSTRLSVARSPIWTTPRTGRGGADDARPRPAPPTTAPEASYRHKCRCSTKGERSGVGTTVLWVTARNWAPGGLGRPAGDGSPRWAENLHVPPHPGHLWADEAPLMGPVSSENQARTLLRTALATSIEKSLSPSPWGLVIANKRTSTRVRTISFRGSGLNRTEKFF
jgi:hypothetical protein